MGLRVSFLHRWLVAAFALLGLMLCGGAWSQVQPQLQPVKIAPDLALVLSRSDLAPGWSRTVRGTRYVKVLIMARSTDTSLAALRAQVLASGGGVYYSFVSMQGLSATLPAAAVASIAARSDVLYVLPNRPAMRLQSVLQRASGQADMAAALGTAAGVDGSGVGIAVLDSGIDFRHSNFLRPDGTSRVAGAVDFVSMRKNFVDGGWRVGQDYSPSSTASIDGTKYWQDGPQLKPKANDPDPYGHGSFVAGTAAGNGAYQAPNSSGIATGATLWDVRVLDERGVGEMADVLAGVDWVVQRARLAGIRVMNLSLGVTVWESYLVDPLARAVRGATATGVTVVAAAGNRGVAADGRLAYGSVTSPGHDPSVITVGAVNLKGTEVRSDDVVTRFSGKGPTRGKLVFSNGAVLSDNLVKPDLVAPGNRLVGVLGSDKQKGSAGWNALARTYPALTQVGATQQDERELMQLSGTSMAAPVVAGAAALMLQANPGLTPPLVKAILQYTAQPLAGAPLVVQGTGMVNVEGAVRLARALRTDIAASVEGGTLGAGASLLAPGAAMPAPSSMLNGQVVPWSRVVTLGGARLATGDRLFTAFQPIWDPTLVWSRRVALRSQVGYQPPGKGVPARTVPASVRESAGATQLLVGPGVSFLDRAFASYRGASAWLTVPLVDVLDRARSVPAYAPALRQGIVSANGALYADGVLSGAQLLMAEQLIVIEQMLSAEQLIVVEQMVSSEQLIVVEQMLRAEQLIVVEQALMAEQLIVVEQMITAEQLIVVEQMITAEQLIVVEQMITAEGLNQGLALRLDPSFLGEP